MFTKPEITIAVHEERTADSLSLECTFTNQGDRPLYVFTCVASRGLKPLPHRAYAAFRDKDHALHLFLGVPPIPRGLRVYAKVVPFSSLLRPRKSVTERYDMPIPVPEWQPYTDPEETEDVEIVEAKKIVLSTEYFGLEDLVREARWDAAAGYFRALGVKPLRARAEAQGTEPVAVVKRLDAFERF
jgi:hypothetical protein